MIQGILLGLSALSMAQAQIGGGSIIGMVRDSSGAPIPDVQVVAHCQDTNEERTATTNAEGYYEFPLLAAGRYYLRSGAKGFKTVQGETFTLSTGTRPRIDFTLPLGDVSEKIDVTASAPLVNTTTTDLGAVVDRARIDELPLNGRNFQDMVNLQAGVTSGMSRGGISFHGSTALGTNFLLDGVDMSFGEVNAAASFAGAGGSGVINTISVDAIEEFKSTGNASSAEYGRAGGGVLNITTRSGSNDWHGALFEYFQNDKLDANNFFANKAGTGKIPLRYNQYGGNLGGPIRRDKLFFFFNYEGDQVRKQQFVKGNVPTAALISQVPAAIRSIYTLMMPTTYAPTSNPYIGYHTRNDNAANHENTYFGRIDWLISSRQRLTVRDNYNDQETVQPNLEPNMPTIYPLLFQNVAVEHTFNLGPTTLNELRLGFNRVDLFRQPQGWENIPGYITAQGISASFPNFIHFVPTTYSLSDNFTIIRGRHSIKMGLDLREVRSVRFQGGPPAYSYNTIADLINQNPASVQLSFTTSKGLRTNNMGYYVQDEWRVSPRLQFNLGLRYEYSPPLRGGFNVESSDPYGPYNAPQQPMFAADHNDFGPRLGLAWTLDSKQRTVLRAGGAVNYVMPQAIFYYDMAFISPLLSGVSTFSAADVPPAYLAYPNALGFQTLLENNPTLLPPSTKLSRSVADYNRRDTYAGMWNVSLQHQVTDTLAVQASYVGQRTVNLIGVRPLNLVDPATKARPVPSLGQVNFEENAGRISYHALELSANQRLWRGLNYDVYFTMASMRGYYAPDDTITFTGSGLQDPNNIAGSMGPFEGQAKRVFRSVFSYSIPGGTHLKNRFLRGVLSGWTLRSIISRRSGIPLNVTTGNDFVGDGRAAGQRPDVVAGVNPYIPNHATQTWLTAAAFDVNTVKTQKSFGNLGFYALTGPAAFSLDSGLHKTFPIHEKQSLTVRLESFNTLNHTVLGNPVTTLNNPLFGTITGTAVGPRVVQLALKYAF
ncbi:MAG: TonB-dependent receptor [Acidobacteria bacterium]|nr:TonB-dependent receptor [Acidobacteriota bacterium]